MQEAQELKEPTRKSIERQLFLEEARKELQKKLRLDY
jgi:predicted nucleic acid binding AN1-type Zn finger protein